MFAHIISSKHCHRVIRGCWVPISLHGGRWRMQLINTSKNSDFFNSQYINGSRSKNGLTFWQVWRLYYHVLSKSISMYVHITNKKDQMPLQRPITHTCGIQIRGQTIKNQKNFLKFFEIFYDFFYIQQLFSADATM